MVWVNALRILTGMMNNVPIWNRTLKHFERDLVNRTSDSIFCSFSSVSYRRTAPTPATRAVNIKFNVLTKIRFKSIPVIEM